MTKFIHGRQARHWQKHFNGFLQVEGKATTAADIREAIERKLPFLLSLKNTASDPLEEATICQVLTSMVMSAGAAIPEEVRQELVTGCDCPMFIRAMQDEVEYRQDRDEATAAELEQEKCQVQLAHAVVSRYYDEVPTMTRLKNLMSGYNIAGGTPVPLSEHFAQPLA